MKSWISAALAALSLTAGSALAQENYPDRTVTLIAPFAAGSGTDLIARVFAQELATKFGQPFVVDGVPSGSKPERPLMAQSTTSAGAA